MTTYDAGSIMASADLNRDPFIEGLRQMQRQGEQFARQRYTATADINTANARRQLDQMRLLVDRMNREGINIRADVDSDEALARIEALRAAQAGLRDETAATNTANTRSTHSAALSQQKDFNLMRTAIEQLLPPLIPLAGGLAGLVGSAGELGIAGVLAFTGISKAIKDNTQLGVRYQGVLGGIKAEIKTMQQSTARGFLPGAEASVTKLTQAGPALNVMLTQSSVTLGQIVSHLTGGLVGGLTQSNGLLQKGEGILEGWSAQFEKWATGPGAATFIGALSTDLDHAVPALEAVAQLFTKLVAAANPIGTVMLDDITMLSKAIGSLPVGLLQAAASAYLIFRTVTAVTGGINAASVALRSLAGAETAAAAGAGRLGAAGEAGAAGGAGASTGLLGGAGALLARAIPIAVGAYVGGTMLRGMAKNSGNLTTPGSKWGAAGADTEQFAGDLLTGHWTSLLGDLKRTGQQNKYLGNLGNDRDAFSRYQNDTYGDYRGGYYHDLGTSKYQAAPNTSYGATTAPTLQQQARPYYQADMSALTRQPNQAQSMLQTQLVKAPDITKSSAAFDSLDKSLQKTVNSQSKWLSLGGPTVGTYHGITFGENTYAAALKASNGDRTKAQALIEATADAMSHNKDIIAQNSAGQQRLNDDISAAQQKYGLTSQQVGEYSSLLGINAKRLADGSMSQKAFVAQIGEFSKVVANADSSVAGWTAAVDQFNQSADTAASRGALIGAALVAANGDAISYQNTMVQAAVANQQWVTDMGAAKKGLIDLKTGTIDYHNAAAAPLLSDLQNLQTANMNAAAAIYQHERAQEGGKKAADDAYNTYRNNTQKALEDEADKLGMNATQAKKFATQYFGLSNAKDIKKNIEMIGQDKTQTALAGILGDLDILVGKKWNPTVGIIGADQAITSIKRVGNALEQLHGKTVVVKSIYTSSGKVTEQAVGTMGAFGTHTIPPNTVFTVGEGASHTWEGGVTDAQGRATIYSNQQSKAMGFPAPRSYASGTNPGESGGYSGVQYPSGGSAAAGGSGSSSSSGDGKGTKDDPKKSGKKLYLYRGLWYSGYDAFVDAKAEYASEHSQYGNIVNEPGNHGYAFNGQTYDKHYEALNAATTARRAGGLLDRQIGRNGLESNTGKALRGMSTSRLLGYSGGVVDDVNTAHTAGAIGEPWVKKIVDDNKTLTTALNARDKLVATYKAQQQKVKDLQAESAADAASVKSTAMGGFDIGTSGNGYGAGIMSTLDQTLADDKKFKALRAQAAKMGLDPRLLAQITKEGPQQGGANLAAIVAGGADYIKQLDAKYAQLDKVAGDIGTAQADADYKSKILAAQAKEATDRTKMLTAQRTANDALHDIRADLHDLDRKLLEAARQKGKK